MKLLDKQHEFIRCIGLLISYAYSKNYKLTEGDAYRDPRVHGELGEKKSYSSANSCHKLRLAMDFNLFVDGEYIPNGDHPAWKDLGEYWEDRHPEARWGGKFQEVDSNHFSFLHGLSR